MNAQAEKKREAHKRIAKYSIFSLAAIFSLIGFLLTTAFVAVKLGITNDPGAVDFNDRYFRELEGKYGKATQLDSLALEAGKSKFFYDVMVLGKYYPDHSLNILNAYVQSGNLTEAQRMLGAANIRLQDNQAYLNELSNYESHRHGSNELGRSGSIFEWMNISEWHDFKIAVAKDKALIDSAAMLTGVEPRLIVAALVGEQIRLFNSDREAYKRWIGPLKILSVESQFSLGVTGIKPLTAETIERNLKDSSSVFYLGPQYTHLLDFKTTAVEEERFQRLTSFKNHFYSYLYAALNIKQLNRQWEVAGYPIDNRPEILATLYNVGFEVSKPKPNPVVGGSRIIIRDKTYTFGAIAYEFYYSGELFDLFPFREKKFDEPNV